MNSTISLLILAKNEEKILGSALKAVLLPMKLLLLMIIVMMKLL